MAQCGNSIYFEIMDCVTKKPFPVKVLNASAINLFAVHNAEYSITLQNKSDFVSAVGIFCDGMCAKNRELALEELQETLYDNRGVYIVPPNTTVTISGFSNNDGTVNTFRLSDYNKVSAALCMGVAGRNGIIDIISYSVDINSKNITQENDITVLRSLLQAYEEAKKTCDIFDDEDDDEDGDSSMIMQFVTTEGTSKKDVYHKCYEIYQYALNRNLCLFKKDAHVEIFLREL